MQRIAFIMKLLVGFESEYKRRHDYIWPELMGLLKHSGIEEYSIFLDEKTGNLFGYMRIGEATELEGLAKQPIMQQWWNYMKDIMETNRDGSPISMPLKEVFYMA
jgi:L-rhamnose mutarotase